jgi:hypothetical protein
MTAQVYADDQALREGSSGETRGGVAAFDIAADAQADLLVRVSSVLNMLNVAPRMFQLESRADGGATVRASVDCAEPQAELIARKLRQLTAVRDVDLKYRA